MPSLSLRVAFAAAVAVAAVVGGSRENRRRRPGCRAFHANKEGTEGRGQGCEGRGEMAIESRRGQRGGGCRLCLLL